MSNKERLGRPRIEEIERPDTLARGQLIGYSGLAESPCQYSGKDFPGMFPGSSFDLRMKPRFFASPSDFRKWLENNHSATSELLVGFYKKGSGKPSITWPESVDEALCFGWIDGIRKRLDDEAYTIRFSPRQPRSIWSAINIRRAQELARQGLMHQSGLDAFEKREENRSGQYSYEQRSQNLPEPYEKKLKRNRAAWNFFQAQTPYYRKTATWWVVSAKREETRLRRLEKLIDDSSKGRAISPLLPAKKPE